MDPSAPQTFLFTDIEGSSALWDSRPQKMRSAHAAHNNILRQSISRFGGEIVKDRGDGYMAAFADPAKALLAAMDVQIELDAADWSDLGSPIRVRIGIHTGVAEPRDGDYFGSDVNIAARLEGLANGGQILVSEATRALTSRSLPSGVDTLDVGVHALKGIAQEEQVYQLTGPGLQREFAPLGTSGRGIPLPTYADSFVGRQTDIDSIRDKIDGGSRLVTLLGPGGIGKTRLAVEAAHVISNGSPSYFADMAPLASPTEIASTFAEAMGVHIEGSADVLDLIADRITEPTLVVLDNLEHLTGVSEAVASLLAKSSTLTLLATSRTRLNIRQESVLHVDPLAVDDESAGAVALFYERAASQGVDLGDADREAVRALCDRLDGLPLAIELVAARTRMLSVGELEAMVGRSLDALGSAGADLPERHRTIRNTIEWSLNGLSDSQRSIFARLSLFPAGPTMSQLEYLCEAAPGALLDDVEALVDNSLAVPARGAAGGTRFRQLSLLREYGAELLDEAAETTRLMHRLVDYYVELAETQQRELLSDSRHLRAMSADHANRVAAMEWSLENGRGRDMVYASANVWIYWFNGDRQASAAAFVTKADELVDDPKLDWFYGFVHGFQAGDYSIIGPRMTAAAQAFEESGNDYWLAMSRLFLGVVAEDPAAGRVLLEHAHSQLETSDDQPGLQYLSLLFLSMSDTRLGELERALDRRLDALAGAKELRHGELIAWMHWNVAVSLLMLGRHTEVIPHLRLGFDYMVAEGYQEGVGSTAQLIALMEAHHGDLENAIRLIGACRAILDRIGVVSWFEMEMLVAGLIDDARARIGNEAVDRLIVQGSELTQSQLIDASYQTINGLES